MANITKTDDTQIWAPQALNASTVLVSPDIAVETALAAQFFIHFARITTSAAAAACNFRIEGSPKSSGNIHWNPLITLSSGITAAEYEEITAAASGQKVISMGSTTNLAVGDIVAVYFTGTGVGSSEWHRIKSVSAGVSITVEDNLVTTADGEAVYDQAEMFTAMIDCMSLTRLRLVADAAAHDQNAIVEAHVITADSIG